MLQKHTFKVLAIAILSSLIVSCSHNDDYTSIEKQESTLLTRSQEWLNAKHVVNNNDVKWNSATFYQRNTGSSFAAIIPVESSTDLQLQKIVLEINNYNITGKLWSFNFKEAQTLSELQSVSTHKILESFTGELKITDLETMETRKEIYKQGKANNNILFSKTAGAGVCNNCHSAGDEGAIKLKEVVVTGPGGSPWPNPITNPTFPPTGPIFGGGGISAPSPKQIIDALTGKAKCLNALLEKNGNASTQKLLANFKGKSEFDIRIGSKDKVLSNTTNQEINGETSYTPGDNFITIEISTSRADQNGALETTRVILHEYIHADILRKLYTLTGTKAEREDFKTLYDLYGSQHGTMAALYLQTMKEALKEFHKNQLPNDYKAYKDYFGEEPSDAFYEAMSWGGLKDSNVKEWNNLSPAKKAEIENLASRTRMLSKSVPCQ
ncbi:hypothetical protein [Flavobacterium poyangense]|uniref:hypothetical protein n=1 Tax=Flavobacterium poyangense TaxID=2204302 RepID=UPI00142385E1|nr:hypothetical protein [Flavobacterium sp. JXAS1]